MNFLTEAFQKLNLVESEEFSLDKKGTEKLKTFLDDDAELDVVTVIDPSEENQADIENVHLGMTILGCEICNQLHYCDPEEVVIDEESQMANVGVCCPYCFGTDGFKIVGTVAPFEDITVEVVDGDKEGIDVKVDGEEVEVQDKKEVNESLGSWIAAKKYQKMKGKEHDVMSKTAGEGASEEEVAKVEKEKRDFQDKMVRNKMAAKAGARAGNKTQQVLDKTATDARNAGAERGRQTIAKNRKATNRTELAKKYFGSQEVDDKQIAKMTKELAAAGYSLQEDLGSWIAAKKLAKMKKNGPKDGEDLESRKDKMDRLKMRAKAGAQAGNKTQKVLDDANAEERRRNGQKGAQARHNQAVDKRKQALVTKFGVKDTAALDNLLKKSGYVAEALCEAPYLDTQYDSRASFYNKARISDDGNTLYSYETKVMEIKDGKPCLTIGTDLLSQTTLRHIKEFLKQKGFVAESKSQIIRDYSCMAESLREAKALKKSVDDLTDEEIYNLVYAKLAEDGEVNVKDARGGKTTPRLNKGVGYSSEQVRVRENSQGIDCIFIAADTKEELAPAIEVANYYDCLYEVREMKDHTSDKKYGIFIDYGSGDLEKLLADEGKPFAGKKKGEKLQNSQKYPIESPLPAQTGLRKNGKLDLSKTKAGDPNKSDILVEGDKQLKEGMEDISITTEDQVIKVKATPRADKETIVPPVEEEEEVIEELPEEEVVEEEDMPIEDTEVDIEDVDEEGFDELGESYLKRVYENVKSFKTVSGQTGKNKIILEGIITFKSGKKAKTSFILEAKEMTKRGKVRFTGMNENISKNKSAYTVTGRVENKKLMVESFNYNYLGKDSTTGKSKKLYGTVRRSR